MVSNNFQQSNGKDFVIYPFEEKFTKGASYDLSLKEIGCLSNEKIINIKDLLAQNLHKLPTYIQSLLLANKTTDNNSIDNAIKTVINNYFIILPYERYLAVTKEHVWLSKFLVGTLHARATLAAKGLIINSTKIDPNFQGQLLISVFNASGDFVFLNKEEPFLTLILHKLEICAVKTQTLAAKRVFAEIEVCCDNNSPKNAALSNLTKQIDVEDDNSIKFKALVESAKTPKIPEKHAFLSVENIKKMAQQYLAPEKIILFLLCYGILFTILVSCFTITQQILAVLVVVFTFVLGLSAVAGRIK